MKIHGLLFFLLASMGCFAIDTAKVTRAPLHKPEGFVQAGYASELWTLSGKLPGAFSATSYTGKGIYAGVGFKTYRGNGNQWGYGLALDYLQYDMQKSIHEVELLETGYSFARISPEAHLLLNPGAPVKLELTGLVNIMAALQPNSNGYWQAGGKLSAQYDAFCLHFGYYFSPSTKGPVPGSFREQMLNIGVSFFPSRLRTWPTVKALFKRKNNEKPPLKG